MSYTQTIYNRLRKAGVSEAGALGMLGNFWCESNCEPGRVQGDFSPYRTASKVYVQDVTNGSITRETFARDGKGFGLYQLTFWSRKQGYYDFWKKSGKALDDAELQTDYAILELKQDYPKLWAELQTINDVFLATSKVCREFERPAVNNIDARSDAANRFRHELDLNGWNKADFIPEPKQDEQNLNSEYWPPRVICKGMNGADVEVLQAVLKARGYLAQNPDGVFGSFLEETVKRFQKAAFPDQPKEWDGICGKKTWAKLLETG